MQVILVFLFLCFKSLTSPNQSFGGVWRGSTVKFKDSFIHSRRYSLSTNYDKAQNKKIFQSQSIGITPFHLR